LNSGYTGLRCHGDARHGHAGRQAYSAPARIRFAQPRGKRLLLKYRGLIGRKLARL
jgi:hypothetical protein